MSEKSSKSSESSAIVSRVTMLASEAASSMLLLASGFSTISREDVSEEAAEVQLERRLLLVSLILASLMVHWPEVQAARSSATACSTSRASQRASRRS